MINLIGGFRFVTRLVFDFLMKNAFFTVIMKKGIQEYEELKSQRYPTLIIFICDYDPLSQGFTKYERQAYWCGSESDCDDKLIACNDGAHAILLNSRYTQRNASPAILEFLDYIRTNDDDADYSSTLTQKAKAEVYGIRHDEKIGRQYMRIELEIQKQRRLGLAEGLAKGKIMEKIELVCKKLSKGKSLQTIAEELNVIEEICQAAEPLAPDYDVEAIYEAMQRARSGQ